jgi:hypothetical protein
MTMGWECLLLQRDYMDAMLDKCCIGICGSVKDTKTDVVKSLNEVGWGFDGKDDSAGLIVAKSVVRVRLVTSQGHPSSGRDRSFLISVKPATSYYIS